MSFLLPTDRYFWNRTFYTGQRPAVNVGLSVSRVGGAAQIKAMKKVSGNLRLDLAQYRDLAAFAQFSSDLDESTRKQIDRGSRMMELLKQEQFAPMAVERQVAIVWAGAGGYLDSIPVAKISDFEREYLEFLGSSFPKALSAIAKEKAISPETEKMLIAAVGEFKKELSWLISDSSSAELNQQKHCADYQSYGARCRIPYAQSASAALSGKAYAQKFMKWSFILPHAWIRACIHFFPPPKALSGSRMVIVLSTNKDFVAD